MDPIGIGFRFLLTPSWAGPGPKESRGATLLRSCPEPSFLPLLPWKQDVLRKAIEYYRLCREGRRVVLTPSRRLKPLGIRVVQRR